MKVVIFGRQFAETFRDPVAQLINLLSGNGISVSFFDGFHQFLSDNISLPDNARVISVGEELSGFSFLISIGGDGTVLESATIVRDSGLPVLAVNTGRLGFLAHADVGEIGRAVEDLVAGRYSLDKRSLIRVTSPSYDFGGFPYALNEVTLLNRERHTMTTIHAYVNDLYMNTYWADGLIVATPTGSTAYSLSCGGPIVTPDSDNLILTPIAPHNLNVRPFVISNSNKVSLKTDGRYKEYLLTIDSRSHTVDAAATIELTRAPFEFNLVNLPDQNFFNTIRNKLGWGLDKRN